MLLGGPFYYLFMGFLFVFVASGDQKWEHCLLRKGFPGIKRIILRKMGVNISGSHYLVNKFSYYDLFFAFLLPVEKWNNI